MDLAKGEWRGVSKKKKKYEQVFATITALSKQRTCISWPAWWVRSNPLFSVKKMQKEKQLKQKNPSRGEICQQLYVVMLQPTGAARSTTMYQCRRPAFTDGWVYKAAVGFFTFREKFDCRNTTPRYLNAQKMPFQQVAHRQCQCVIVFSWICCKATLRVPPACSLGCWTAP